MIRLTSVMAFFLLLNACVSIPSQPKTAFSNCLSFYSDFDQLIDEEDIRDVQASLISDYSFLSVNRFLTSFKTELNSLEKRDYWLSLLADLNLEARVVEWQNLSKSSQQKLHDQYLLNNNFESYISSCSRKMRDGLTDSETQAVIKSAKVKDDYSMLQRVLGVYPVTSLFVSRQITKHQTVTKSSFEKDLSELPVEGRLVRYSMTADDNPIKHDLDLTNPLKIPVVSDEQLSQLFHQHAPVVEMDERDENDVIGLIRLNKKGYPQFFDDKSVFYVLPSYARFNGEVLLQLNYIFWFSSRPKIKPFDIYSGKLDGLIWRVTLDHEGEPILYDSVHNCGCYHKFYLSDKLAFKGDVAEQEREPPFVAQTHVENKQLVLRIGSVSHFVDRVYALEPKESKPETKNIQIKPYLSLRSLGNGEQPRSLFGSDSLINGTARAERWLLWPMGVPSAGAMRQWGHHAVAFVGKRYFDDPKLLDKYFSAN